MNFFKSLIANAFGALIVSTSAASSATINSVTDPALVDATVWGFEELDLISFDDRTNASLASPDDFVKMQPASGSFYEIGSYAGSISTGLRSVRTRGGSSQTYIFTFNGTVSAFALSLFGNDGSNWDAVALDAHGNAVEATRWTRGSATSRSVFQGVQTDGIAAVRLQGGDDVIFDQFTYAGAMAAVPLPSSFLLLLGCLSALAWTRRRPAAA
jgi:hypothetical protein